MKYCSHCGKELLNEAVVCPGCGKTVEENNLANNQPVQASVNESAQQVIETPPQNPVDTVTQPAQSSVATATQTAQSPVATATQIAQNPVATVTQTPQKPKKKKTKIIVIISICAAVIILAVVGLFVKFSIDKKNYVEKMDYTYSLITSSYDKAEEYCELKAKAVYNTIYKISSDETDKYTTDSDGYFHSDINDSLQAFYNDNSAGIKALESNINLIKSYMKELKNNNLSSKYEQEYQSLNKLYTIYSSLTNLINAGGYTYNSFTEAFKNAQNEFSSAKSEASLYFIN